MEGLLHPFYLNQFKFVFGAPGYRESFCSKRYIMAFEPRIKIFYPSTKCQNESKSYLVLLFTCRNINIMAKKS